MNLKNEGSTSVGGIVRFEAWIIARDSVRDDIRQIRSAALDRVWNNVWGDAGSSIYDSIREQSREG